MPRRHPSACPRRRQRGAAILVAMVLLTVVATMSAGMVWQQWRGIQVEVAERSRSQSAWILMGALDWARLILREHRRDFTSLEDTWAQPLAEARLSTFLAADKDNNAEGGPEAFLSGLITDAQTRYNLRNLVADGKPVEKEVEVLKRLCEVGGLSPGVAVGLAQSLAVAWSGTDPKVALGPGRLEDLAWIPLTADQIERLRPLVWISPGQGTSKVNLNTASREVLAAVIEGIDLGTADRLVQTRKSKPFQKVDDARTLLPPNAGLEGVTVKSEYFEVRGRLRLEDRVLEEVSLVHKRNAGEVAVEQRQRVSTVLSTGGG